MITLGSMLAFVACGLVIGTVARMLTPRERGDWVFSLLIGVLGAFAGGFVGHGFGLYHPGEHTDVLMSVVGAMIFAGIYQTLRRHFAEP